MQATLRGKVTRELEVRSSAARYYELFAFKPYEIAKLAPSVVQGCKVIAGEFGKNGSVIFWNYTFEGKECVAKERLENCDAEKGTITYTVIEGEFLMGYKYFVIHLHVMPRSRNTALVKWTIEYEKINEEVPSPDGFLDVLARIQEN